MAAYSLSRRLAVEAIGTGFLVCAVVGSGIMAARLSGDIALVLLCNAVATGAILIVLITIFAPVSGAHFNPAVTLGFALGRDIGTGEAVRFIIAQIIGGLAGTLAAHLMFELPAAQIATTVRTGPGQWFAEALAAFGLMTAILSGVRFQPRAVPWLVGLYIIAAYWFTASTSFANPAVAIARAITDTFAGIRPADLPAFIIAECIGAALAVALSRWLHAAPASGAKAHFRDS